MRISAQVSLYPLRQARLTPVIEQALALFRELGLHVEPGIMSTTVIGERDLVFGALQDVFCRAAASGDLVMQVTFSNACPLPGVIETHAD